MILLFIIAFTGHLIMFFTGCLKSAYYHSSLCAGQEKRICKIRLRKHWRLTWLLFAACVYAGLHL